MRRFAWIVAIIWMPCLSWAGPLSDLYAFVSYDDPTKVTLIMTVQPHGEPSRGPDYAPFDDTLRYAFHIDNSHSAADDIVFEVEFSSEIRSPSSAAGFLGAGDGITAPANSPPPVAPGTLIVPSAITALEGAGANGLHLRQHYSVTLIEHGEKHTLENSAGGKLYAVPSNVGPRTMPNYPALAAQGIYELNHGIRVFAGTVDDPFFADSGALYDTLNFRIGAGGGVLSAAADANDQVNTASDSESGFNVNCIAIEVPITLLTGAMPRPPRMPITPRSTRIPTSPASSTASTGSPSPRRRAGISNFSPHTCRRSPHPAPTRDLRRTCSG